MEETLFKLARAITDTGTDKVAVYTNPGSTWISEGSFIVPSAGGTVSI